MADHKPRIVAFIPKRAQVVEVDAEADEEPDSGYSGEEVRNMRQEQQPLPSMQHLADNNNAATQQTRANKANPLTSSTSTTLSSSQSNDESTLLKHAEPIPSDPRKSVYENIPYEESRINNLPKYNVQPSECTAAPIASINPKKLSFNAIAIDDDDEDDEKLRLLRRDYMYDSVRDRNACLVGLKRDIHSAKAKMAAASPKSPKPAVSKPDKEESIWDKIGTLGRKKRIKEVQEVQEEGKNAIDSPGFPHMHIISPEDYDLEENEERCMIDSSTYTNPQFLKLVKVLVDWINDELASQRIIVQDLAEDLYDGQVLQKLLEKLTGDKLDVREVTQSEEGQKQKLHAVLSHFNYVLGLSRTGSKKWNVEAIHSKNIVPIMHLLVALARHFRPPVRLTEHVNVQVVIVKKVNGKLEHHNVTEVITTAYDDVGMRCERDAIDALFDHGPDNLQVVKKCLVTFVNKHLNKINLEVTEIETQFHDGVYLTFLIGLLEGFFVLLHSFHPTPKDFEQKVHNMSFAFELMEEVGISKLKARPEDIVNQDLKSTLRVLYALFSKYKVCEQNI